MKKTPQTTGPLKQLQALTPARIGLPRAGSSLATREILDFDLDHARARDAVHLPFNSMEIRTQLEARGIKALPVQSAAADRFTYLQRPDLGRQLDEASREILRAERALLAEAADIGIVIADGLSTTAIHANALAFLDEFLPLAHRHGWRHAPVIIASQARVALADAIGEILATLLCVILIGERPGLSASDSMGIYVTYAPRKGRTDAERNCISNIRQGGLKPGEAARQLERLVSAAFERRLTGVRLEIGDAGEGDRM